MTSAGDDAGKLRLRQLIDSARAGRGGVVIVRAASDPDRDEFLAHADESAEGFTVLRVGCARTEAQDPYSALERLLQPLLRFADRIPARQRTAVMGVQEQASGDDDVLDLFHGVMNLLAVAAEGTPLMVLVEDAQWIDESSARALMFVRRRLRGKRILLVLGTSSSETRLTLARNLPQIELGGSHPSPAEGSDSISSLTLQELQVAAIVADGATNREAADSLHLSQKTIEFHLRNVYRKLEIRSRSELVRLFMQVVVRRR